MATYIYDPNVIDVLGKIEGMDWVREQASKTNGDSVAAFVAAWKKLQAELAAANEAADSWTDNLNPRDWDGPSSDGAIYGEGGYARYIVRGNGEVVLLASSTRPERVALARAAGVRVV